MVYSITKSFPADEKFGLISQLRRSVYSIPMNLVEGSERDSQKEFLRYVVIAKASCEEAIYQIDLSKDLGYISDQDYAVLHKHLDRIGGMLYNLKIKLQAGSAEPGAVLS